MMDYFYFLTLESLRGPQACTSFYEKIKHKTTDGLPCERNS